MNLPSIPKSFKTFVYCVLFIIALWSLWIVKDIILLLFICFVLMEALNPTVNRLQKLGLPRPIAIVLIYVVVIALLSFTIAGIIPILISQTSELIRILPSTINNLNLFGFTAFDVSSQFKFLETIPTEVAKAVLSFVSNIFSAFVILVITFYLLVERPHLANHCIRISKNPKIKDLVIDIFCKLELKLGSWVNGEIILMSVIGIMSYIGYYLLGLPYALPLAIIAGLLEIVPNIGPIVTSVIAVLVGLTVSPFTAFLTVLLSIFVHQSENNFITPKIMKQAVGINPVITILTIATGAKLAGIGGALLAVPLYLILETIITVYLDNNKS